MNIASKARRHDSEGGKASSFAEDHGLPRTTVTGSCKVHKGPQGRPRKLTSKDETLILTQIIASQNLQTWETVRGWVLRASCVELERRSIFRLLTKLGLNAEPPNAGEPISIVPSAWIQPPETIVGDRSPLRATIWRLLNGRGMDCFMMTADESDAAVQKVAAAIVERFKGRMRRRHLRTNHSGLAEVLREKLKGWQVDTTVPWTHRASAAATHGKRVHGEIA